ncbi:MAG: hypothetical protein ACTS4U_01450 [Candidatus Hodgkinia cicadicola]
MRFEPVIAFRTLVLTGTDADILISDLTHNWRRVGATAANSELAVWERVMSVVGRIPSLAGTAS